MNKIVTVIVSTLFIFSFIGTTFSAEKGKNLKVAAGAVKAIDKAAKTITIKEDKKEAFTCFFDDKTIIRANTGGKIDDMKIGDIAALAYEEVNGKNIARGITVISQSGLSSSEKVSKPANTEVKK